MFRFIRLLCFFFVIAQLPDWDLRCLSCYCCCWWCSIINIYYRFLSATQNPFLLYDTVAQIKSYNGHTKRINIIFMNVEFVSFFFSVYLCEKTHIYKPAIAHTILFHLNPFSNTKDLAMRLNRNAKLCYVCPLHGIYECTHLDI